MYLVLYQMEQLNHTIKALSLASQATYRFS